MNRYAVVHVSQYEVALYAQELLVCDNELQQIAMNSLGHVFRGFTGPEKLKLKLECLGCNGWAYAEDGKSYEFVIGVREKDHHTKLIGMFCSGCMNRSDQEKKASIIAAVRNPRERKH